MFDIAEQHGKDDQNESNNGTFLSKFMSLNLAKLADEECVPRQMNDARLTKSLPAKHYESGGINNISPFRSDESLGGSLKNVPTVPIPRSYLKYTTSDESAHFHPTLVDSSNSAKNSKLTPMAEELLPSKISKNNIPTVTRDSPMEAQWVKSASSTYEDLKNSPQQHPRPSLMNDEVFRELQDELKSAQAVTSASIQEVTANFFNEQKKKRQEELKQKEEKFKEEENDNSSLHVKSGQGLRSTLVVMTGLQGIQDVFSSFTTQIRKDLEDENPSHGGASEIVVTRGSLGSDTNISERVSLSDLPNLFEDTIREEEDDELSDGSFNDDDTGNDKNDDKHTAIGNKSQLSTKRKSIRRSHISLSSNESETDAVVLLAYNPGDVDGSRRISIITMESSSHNGSLSCVMEDDEMDLAKQESTFNDSDRTLRKQPRSNSYQRRSSLRFDKLNRSSMVLLTDDSPKIEMENGKNPLDEDETNPQLIDLHKLKQSLTSESTARVSALAFECEIDFDDIVNMAGGDK